MIPLASLVGDEDALRNHDETGGLRSSASDRCSRKSPAGSWVSWLARRLFPAALR